MLFSAWQHFELLRHGYKLERCSGARRRKRRQPHLLSRWNAPRAARIEKLATERLGMVAPRDAEAVGPRAGRPHDAARQSVVAAR